MRITKLLILATSCLSAIITICASSLAAGTPPAVGSQYDTTHVYVAPRDVDRFVKAILATFGGQSTKQVVVTVTPTPSSTSSQLLLTPFGSLSVFGFRTPVPYPFGLERTGYLVRNLDAAVVQAQADGATVLVSAFPDPIGRDALIQWPGGINMQLYWHTKAPSYPVMQTVPENRIYLPRGAVAAFVSDFTRFSGGQVNSDDAHAPGVEIGRPGDTYRRVRITSTFGRLTLLATDGQLPYPYGRELTGYEVPDIAATLAKARTAGVKVLAGPAASEGRLWAMIQFPGGYIAEVHSKR